jgi:transcriptional regulator with XRE-family HTH domain
VLPVIDGTICRMVRAGLHMSQERLASLTGVSVLTVRDFENGHHRLHANHRAALAAVLRAAGAEFADGKVWLRRSEC